MTDFATRPEFESLRQDVKTIEREQAEMRAAQNQQTADMREIRDMLRAQSKDNAVALEHIGRRIDTITSWRSVIGWAVVTASSAGVATAITHFTVMHP